MAGEAGSRWRVLTLVAMFDIVMFVVRAAAKAAAGSAVASALALQLGNMAALYSLTALLNARSRRLGSRAAHQVGGHLRVGVKERRKLHKSASGGQGTFRRVRPPTRRPPSRACRLQEEAMLCCLIAGAISVLLLSLRPETAADYVYAALFLTCTSSVLKLRWFVGTLALAVPVGVIAATNLRLRIVAAAACGVTCACAGGSLDALALEGAGLDGAAACPAGGTASWLQFEAIGPLPLEALVHILVAWAVGALMAYVSGE